MSKIVTKISIEVPYDNLCDACSYIKYIGQSVANCTIFFVLLEEIDDRFIPCPQCLKARKEYENMQTK